MRWSWTRTWGAALALLGSGAMAQVGLQEIRVGEMPVTLVYPSSGRSVPTAFGPFTVDVARAGAPQRGNGRLVLISHGTGGNSLPDVALARSLALAGFVVALPMHRGDNYMDTSRAGPDSFASRPVEALAVVERLAQQLPWSGLLQLDRVGVHGMSAGGTTGLQLAGAQWTMLTMVRHCLAESLADEGFCFNGAIDPARRAARAARYEQARHVPSFLLPADLKELHGGRTPATPGADPRPDPRIAAVSLAVPVAAIFTPESLARIRIPVGLVTASSDQVLVPRFHSEHVLAHCRSCSRLAELGQAGHFDVLEPWPESVAREVAAAQVRGGLPTPGFDTRLRTEAHRRIVAFHRQHLLP